MTHFLVIKFKKLRLHNVNFIGKKATLFPYTVYLMGIKPAEFKK